jgi:hypothetical protein
LGKNKTRNFSGVIWTYVNHSSQDGENECSGLAEFSYQDYQIISVSEVISIPRSISYPFWELQKILTRNKND